MSLSPLASLLAGKRLLLFDLDGTLVDSSLLHARAFRDAFAPADIAVDYSTIAGMVTEEAVDKLLSAAGRSVDADQRRALIDDKRRRAQALITHELRPLTGAVEFVHAAGRRFRLALCTSASRAGAELALRRTKLDGSFELILTADDVRLGKPHPEMFLKAVELTGTAREQALVFEDAPSGLAAAAAAGIEAIRIVETAEPGGTDWTTVRAALEELGA